MTYADIAWNVALSGFVCVLGFGFAGWFVETYGEEHWLRRSLSFSCNLGFAVMVFAVVAALVAKVWGL